MTSLFYEIVISTKLVPQKSKDKKVGNEIVISAKLLLPKSTKIKDLLNNSIKWKQFFSIK